MFDRVLLQTLRNFDKMPNNLINTISKIVFAQFPSLDSGNIELILKIFLNQKLVLELILIFLTIISLKLKSKKKLLIY